MSARLLVLLFGLLFARNLALAQSDAPTVGIEGRLEVLLPTPALIAKPADRAAPMNVRIAATRPHGALTQYDLRYIGLVPGEYDLRAYLLPKEGTPAASLPPLNVTVRGLLPEENEGRLALVPRSAFARLGGYQAVMTGTAALWLLCAIPLFLAHRRRKAVAIAPVAAPPPTLAERLHPLVEAASHGTLTADEQAHLERMLIGHWRERLALDSLDPSEAMSRLRAHPEAGGLLRALEDWLHRRPGSAAVDLEAVLAPYAAQPSAPIAGP